MERAALLSISLFGLGCAFGQIVLPDGTNLAVDGGTSLRVDAPLTWTLEAGSGMVNNGSIVLGPGTELDEALGASITGTGTEQTTRDLSAPLANENPGGLGGVITTDASLGSTLIVRGHTPFTDYSGHTSLARWIDFNPANNSGLNATLGFRYDPAELNGLVETDQRVHIRAVQDIWWYFGSTVDTGTHTVSASALDSLGLFTTFDEDLPNAIAGDVKENAFALLGAPGEKLYLRVPAGGRAETLDVFAISGARIASFSPHWGEGLHAIPELPVAGGVYQLRVNGQRTFPFVRP
jgi:hypothetical protein